MLSLDGEALSIYRRLQRASELTYRSVDEILSSAITVALNVPPDLPAERQDELAAMGMLSDAALWAASESSLSPAQQRRLHNSTMQGGTFVDVSRDSRTEPPT